ncbi:HAD-IA family hydrolase [Streptomyces rhizosphaericola]|uniref:HAD-IA family hydrolase n=1 Tax=Streptomyces rhizosphaericola TaxID=2564098 RepID=UPI0039F08252
MFDYFKYLTAAVMTVIVVWRFPAVRYADAHRRALWGGYAGFAVALWLYTPAAMHAANHIPVVDLSALRGAVSQTEWNEFAGKMLGVPADNLMGRIFGDLRPEPLMINAAAAARRAGIKVGILSNSVGLAPWDLYDGYELERLYDVVVISEQHLLRKPDPELFEITLKLMDLPAEECVFVDDTEAYVQAAEELGLTGVHNQDPRQTVATLSELLGVDLSTSS